MNLHTRHTWSAPSSRDFLVKGLCKDKKYNCLSRNVFNIWFFCSDFSLSCIQMGAGGFGVSLPCRSRSGRLFVSRQPDQGCRPGLQQRGQLHVSANLLITRWPTARSPSDLIWSLHKHTTQSTQTVTEGFHPPLQLQYCRHCLNISLEHFMDVQFAHSDWGTLGRFYWLEVHIWQIWSLLWHHDMFETWLLLVLFAISDVVICTVFSSVWLPCHSFDFLLIFKGKW